MDHQTHVEESRKKLLHVISDSVEKGGDITFIRGYGNRGDDLIYAGTRQLLSQVRYTEISIEHLQGVTGHTALLSGGGAWCGAHQHMARYLPHIEKRFERVIILPTSFDISIPCVRETLSGLKEKTFVFAREEESLCQIRNLCRADIAHDCAFFFDFSPYKQASCEGTLMAYRQDKEAARREIPAENNDLSATCESLDEFLWTIARYETVLTDRAHVMIAAALLGKTVHYQASNYHKVPKLAAYLKKFPVYRNADDEIEPKRKPLPVAVRPMEPSSYEGRVRLSAFEIMEHVPFDKSFVMVDEDQLRLHLGKRTAAIPFLEKDGEYWGPPSDDEAAIRELERLRAKGADFIVVAWPSFWYLDHYKEWYQFLRSNFPCLLENERLLVFNLRSKLSTDVFDEVRKRNLTYLEKPALEDLSEAVSTVEKNQVPGCLIEAGCALGGSSIVIANFKQQKRPFYIYDVFGQIPPPSERDGADVRERYQVIASGASKGIGQDVYYGYRQNLIDEITGSFKSFGIDFKENEIHLVKGYYQDTLWPQGSVAFAHIDCDWYESVLICLLRIVPLLSVGGILVVDDYEAWSGCKRAVDECFDKKSKQGFTFLNKSRLWIVRNKWK